MRPPTEELATSANACNTGCTAAELGKTEKAAKLFRLAVKLDPQCVQARCNLAEIELQRGRLRQALKIARQALVLAPDNTEVNYVLARTLLANGFRFAAIGPLTIFVNEHDVCDERYDFPTAVHMLLQLRSETVREGER